MVNKRVAGHQHIIIVMVDETPAYVDDLYNFSTRGDKIRMPKRKSLRR